MSSGGSTPLNTAHQHAANADDYIAQGLLIPAADEHLKAAEAFRTCVEAATDENTKRTLRMLYNDHAKAGKELQRRIAKLREENKDPSLPQKPTSPVSNHAASVPPVVPAPVPSPPPHPHNRMTSSQTVDESFMVLGQRSETTDPFNQFWKITEGMLDYLSQPVAFATAPLAPSSLSSNAQRRDPSSSSDTDFEDPISRGLSRGIGMVRAARSRMLTRADSTATGTDGEGGRVAGSNTFPPRPQFSFSPDSHDDWFEEVRADDDDDLADSFCLVSSKNNPSPLATLQNDNDALKAELEETRRQLASVEGMLKMRQEQDQQLRDSILLARKEAHRAMLSSTVASRQCPPTGELTALDINIPSIGTAPSPLNPGRDREPQLIRRVRELEEELRVVRVENEKQKVMIVRFRERWEKLKESAKRKKEAKAAAEATNIVGERIDEEPEAEEEAERDDARRMGL
ncbi:hypothetical protein WOLCODRAFT_136176 [Wolfiporia cocos MD-104 SS10]|uniref:MIT domain-containing protein n=1 Tax=Wolfiporia cocos (strain MD-104) TaxID=742152 RepID=A0A2H3J7X1_WOLCO|nr:hypothetical protein WOLCODRAFT_136176 [Wolfiporia cocos MD-104 SS10]